MITEEEARRQHLPGSDTFIRTQLAYKDELHRDSLIVHLNREAYKLFVNTVLIGQYPLLQKEAEAARTGNMFFPAHVRRIEYIDLENFQIAAGFELHLKACLLAKNIVIHWVSKDPPPFKALRTKQIEDPVYTNELLAIEGFVYNGQRNILRGITLKSLDFDQIMKHAAYRSVLGKSSDFLAVVEDYRSLRNQIHLPGDVVEAPHINSYEGDSLMRSLVTFINEDIVEYNNTLIDTWKLNVAQKVPLLPYL